MPEALPASTIPVLGILAKSGIASYVLLALMLVLSIGIGAVLILKWMGNRKKKAAFARWNEMMGDKPSFQDLVKLQKAMPETPMGRICRAALREMESLSAYVSYDSLESRSQLVAEAVERATDAEKTDNDRYLIYLAFCTATGPLLGLMGTVWGIMNSFWNIGLQGSANITVVAPGIAEALLATLGGLLVAIPASMGYNFLVSFNRRAEAQMYNFGSELVSLFKRGDLTALERLAKE